MKKAVFIINSLQNGGAERVVITQAEYLKSCGVDVTVICLRNWIQYDVDPGVRIVCLRKKRTFSLTDYLTGPVFLTRRLNRELKRITGDGETVLLTSNLLYPNLITRLSAYSGQAIYVLHAHQDILPFYEHPVYKCFIRWLYKKRGLVCVGKTVAEEMHRVYHIEMDRIRTVVNPINGKAVDRLKKAPFEYGRPYILFCGRLTAVKCPERMIEAYYKGGFYKEYSLVILGIGEMEGRLRQMARDDGIADKVFFGGWEKNVYKWMYHARLLVLTSDTEGLSMTLLEALYCGCPVVAVNSQGPEQILTGSLRGYLCAGSPEAVAETMEKALASYPADLKRYAEAYSVEKNVERYLAIYREWNETLK